MSLEKQTLNVEVKDGVQSLRVIHEPLEIREIHEWNVRRYNLESIKAVVDLVNSKGSKENTIIFYNNTEIRVILDDSIMDRPLDEATYKFQKSLELLSWLNIFGRKLSQKDLVDFLKRKEDDEVQDRESLIANVSKLRVMTEIKGEYQFDEEGNISVMYKESNGTEGMLALPKYIYIKLPVLNEGTFIANLELELELYKPKSEDEKPTIVLNCPKLDKHVKDAVLTEVANLKEALKDYLIIAGRD